MAVFNGFGDQIRALAKKADERANAVTAKIIFDVGTSLVLKSPVGDPKFWRSPPPPGYVGGRFRANWQYALDRMDITTTENRDKTGQPTISRITGEIPGQVIGHVHYITNSLPYANRLEDGWSWRQAPNGMVQVTVLEFDPIVKRAVAELS